MKTGTSQNYSKQNQEEGETMNPLSCQKNGSNLQHLIRPSVHFPVNDVKPPFNLFRWECLCALGPFDP